MQIMATFGPHVDIAHLDHCLTTVSKIKKEANDLLASLSLGLELTDEPADHLDSNVDEFASEIDESLEIRIPALFGEAERSINAQPLIGNPLPLGQSIYLALDGNVKMSTASSGEAGGVDNNVASYADLVEAHRWLDKTHALSARSTVLLSHKSLNRSHGKVIKSRRRPLNTSHAAPPPALDMLISNMSRLYGDMSFTVRRPMGSKLNAIVEVYLDAVFKAVLIFRGLMIECVAVKSQQEDGDVHRPSRHRVFRRVSQNATAAMLNFYSPLYPELAVKSFITYLHSYINLFSERCKQCEEYLNDNLPPTWRDFKALDAYHDNCRPL